MLALDSIQPGKFTNIHGRLATAFADQVAIALENTRLFEETQWLAIHDPLTGLYNRRQFMSLAWGEFQRAVRYDKALSVIMLDIDHFKKVNDTFGHLIGDQVLQSVAQNCANNLRIHDVIGRYGGEEFVILLPETSAASPINPTNDISADIEPAKVVAERLRSVVENTFIHTERGEISISISLGIAEKQPQIDRIEQLIDFADQALLQAKRSGRNRVAIWKS
jgi:diguanylate cyclase (GGDEF)-like protein